MTGKRVARGTLPPMPAVEVDETVTEAIVPSTTLRMTSRPPRVTTTTPGVMQKVLPR
jgi:hypothetical protein